MRWSPLIATLISTLFVFACVGPSSYRTDLSKPEAKTCVDKCHGQANEDELADCVKECPGTRWVDGPCTKPKSRACVQVDSSNGNLFIGLILGALLLVVIYAALPPDSDRHK